MLVRLRDDGKCAFEFLDSPPMRPTTSGGGGYNPVAEEMPLNEGVFPQKC